MLSEGAVAPAVELPAYVDEERKRVDLDDYLGEGIVVLAFYPADFNPACSMQSSDLGDLDLFTMQKDVSVFGVSPDSTYSHEAFAERFSLRVPLLSDVDGEATAAYDVAMRTDTGEPVPRRAVFVVDHHGEVRYAWATDDLAERIDVDPVKQAVGDIGGDETALERYRAGYEHYVEGREAFEAAMAEYEDREWIPARSGFDEAEPSFTAAADHLDTAVRFAETAAFETVVDRAEEKADTLQHATNWLGDSADALGSGRGKRGTEYRDDAERLLDAAGDLPDPPDPDLFTLTDDGVELDDAIVVDPGAPDDAYALEGDDGAPVDTDLGLDDEALDAAVAADDGSTDYDGPDGESVEGDAVEGDLEMDLSVVEGDGDDAGDGDNAGDDGEDDWDHSIEGDTVEGDLDVDLAALEDAEAAVAGDERIDETRTGTADGAGAGTEDAGAADGDGANPGRSAAGGVDGDSGRDGAGDGDAGGDEDGGADADEDTGVGNDGDDVEELELADPTEADDEDDDDERSDWNIPGR